MWHDIKYFRIKFTLTILAVSATPLSNETLVLLGFRDIGLAEASTFVCPGGGGDGVSETYTCGDGEDSKITMSYGETFSCACSAPKVGLVTYKCTEDIIQEGIVDGVFILVSNTCQYVCTNGDEKDCSSAYRYCTQTCSNNMWGAKVWGDCKPGYLEIGDTCYAECDISNGIGYEISESSSSSSSQA